MCQRKTICDECKKDSDGLMKCDNMGEIEYLCPDCMKDSDYCLMCGYFSSGTEGFDIVHPGYCDNCIEQMEDDDWDDWGDESEYDYRFDDED